LTANNIIIGGKGDDSIGVSAYNRALAPTGRNLYLYNSGDGTDLPTAQSPGGGIANDILSLGQVQYSKLALTGAGTIDISLGIGRTLLGVTQYRAGDATNDIIQH